MDTIRSIIIQHIYSRSINAAGNESDIQMYLPKLKIAYGYMVSHMSIPESKRDMVHGLDSSRIWYALINAGNKVVSAVLSTRSIPDKFTKPLEMVYRLMSNSRRPPKDMDKWWRDNRKRIEFLIDAAEKWPPKVEGSDELFTVGSFRVHNTVGSKGAELESLRKALERVEKAVRSNPVPGFSRVLYGDVHIVPRITKAHHAAWYYPSDDSIYLRQSKSTGMDEIHALIHELGHRYWAKFADMGSKKEWIKHHMKAESKHIEVELPDIGDEILVKIKGSGSRYPTVTRKDSGHIHYALSINGINHEGRIPIFQAYQFYLQQQKTTKNFPTRYSATSHEEHFCESVALKALDNLTNEFLVPFDSIWG